MSTIPRTQTAVIQNSDGQPTIIHDAAVPALRPGTILVKSIAVALNPSDYKLGTAFPSPGAIVGVDFAGHIIAIHSSLSRTDLHIGDVVCGAVHGSNPDDHESGSFAEYILAPADLILKVPPNLAPERAATLGCALLTSSIALWDSLKIVGSPEKPVIIEPGKKAAPVLVYGGSTTSGTMAVQLLKLSGYDPIATCSPRNFEMVRSYGASAVFDYTSSGVAGNIKDHTKGRIRHALDCITDKASLTCCYASIGRPGGRYASLEASKAEWRSREAVKAEFIMNLEAFGKVVSLGGEYGRPASKEKHELAVRLFKEFQRILDEEKVKTHPIEVVGKGFQSILGGLALLKSGSVLGKKLVILLE